MQTIDTFNLVTSIISEGHVPSAEQARRLASALKQSEQSERALEIEVGALREELAATQTMRDHFRDQFYALQQLRAKHNRRKARRLARKMIAEGAKG